MRIEPILACAQLLAAFGQDDRISFLFIAEAKHYGQYGPPMHAHSSNVTMQYIDTNYKRPSQQYSLHLLANPCSKLHGDYYAIYRYSAIWTGLMKRTMEMRWKMCKT